MFSDLHLQNPLDPLYPLFLKALNAPQNELDAVVLAGDIFDLFVGKNEHFYRENRDFFSQIETLVKRNVHVYYIEGNHDFHLQEKFTSHGIRLHDESIVLSFMNQKKIFIAHGDLVDLSDDGYLRLRTFFRSSAVKWLVNHLPIKAVTFVADRLSREPAARTHELPENWLEADRSRLRSIFHDFARQKNQQGYDYVVLGHCHDLDELKPFYFNMGYPPVHRQFLYYESISDSLIRRQF